MKLTKIVSCLPLFLALSACQHLPLQTANETVPQLQAPAKEAVQGAMSRHFRHNFSYKTTLIKHQTAPVDTDGCAAAHDDGYIALIKTAKQAGLDLSADRYLDEKNRLKSEFLACLDDDSHAWHGYQKDRSHTQAVAKHYLTDPMSMTITGNFRPLMGQVSALPQFSYRFGAMDVMVNQPIVVDLKTGTLYLWADNVAFANALFLDTKLGDNWRNQWLKLPLDDGSLPQDFAKQVAKSYANAHKIGFESGEFSYTSEPLPFLPPDLQAKTAHVVKTQTAEQALAIFAQDLKDRYEWLNPSDNETADDSVQTAQKMTSRQVVQKLFAVWLERAEIDTDDETKTNNSTVTSPKQSSLFYGLSQTGKLLWVAKHTPQTTTLTTFDDGLIGEFDRLPSAYRTPTPDNSVNLLTYFDELKEQAKGSNNPYLQALFAEQE